MLWAGPGEDTGNIGIGNVEAVTVTANKVEENIQDVPQSISVIDDTILKEKEIRKIPQHELQPQSRQ